ncbi:MAG: HDOD domain-containing protein, partial [Candidatus Zixiibacteriota bacterium]
MDRQTLLSRIETETGVLSLPQALSEMLQAMDDPEFSADQLAAIILKDPGLTARILQLANSPFYRHVSEISTVNQAVQMLGMTTVRCLALSASIFNIDRFEKGSGLDVKEFFTTIMTVGAASQQIATMKKYPAAEEALVTGLLHEIGTMYLAHHFPKEYRKVIESASLPEQIADREREVFGIDHCEIGYHLTKKWSLPEAICEAIRDHRTPPEEGGNQLTDIVRLAYLLTHNVMEGGVEQEHNPFEKVYAAGALLGLSQDVV